ncbi:MAG: hypothetical protein Q8Q74_20010, partial [Polaromonas sp.]|nr:hypothetical protein [Polaromonas sp.]
MRIFFLVLLGLVLRAGHTQDFGRLYSDSVTITLAEPLQWVAVPKGTIASPDAFTAAGSWGLQPYTDSTVLPTSGKQDVWATFSLPATETLQTWFIRLPGQALVKASLFSRGPQGEW